LGVLGVLDTVPMGFLLLMIQVSLGWRTCECDGSYGVGLICDK
jgi:hypothetical protein